MLVKAWGRTYNIPYRITRTTNNYGERQHDEKLIPHTITSLLGNQKIMIHGDGSYIRNWIYVKDNCNAVLKVLENGTNSETYHISSDEEYSVSQVVEMVCKKLEKNIPKSVQYIQNRAGQDLRYALDNTKIKKELDWRQQYKLYDMLDDIIRSYKNAKLI